MNKPDSFARVVKAYHEWHYGVDIYILLGDCIEKLRKEGHTPPSAARCLHDHLELAANWKEYWSE